jgi:hypothetical protein
MDPREELARIRGHVYVPEPEPIAITAQPKPAWADPAPVIAGITSGEVKRMIASALASHEYQIAMLNHKIESLQADNDEFRRKLGCYAMLEYGQAPHTSDMTYAKAQIWHSPHLTAVERRNKQIWSLRLTVDVMHHRVIEEINIGLYPFKKFCAMARKPRYRTDPVLQECERIRETGYGDDTWAGFIQSFTRGGGRPYTKEQAAFLTDHERDVSPNAQQARLHFLLAGEKLGFGIPRPSAGGEGSSLWYVEWRPTKAA